MRAVFRTVLVSLLAVALIALFLRNADLGRVWGEMRRARLDLLVGGALLTPLMYLVRAERWQYMLEPLGHTRFWVAFRTTVIGFAATMLLPARVGEVLRPYLLARHEGLPATAAFATIVVERILDLAAVVFLLALYFVAFGSAASQASPSLYRAVLWGGLATAPISFGALAAMFVMAGHPERLHALVMKGERVLPGRFAHAFAGLARTFAEGLAVVRRPQRLLITFGWSLVLWILIAMQIWLTARAFAIALPFVGSFLLTAMLVVGVSLPTPGGVGGVHEAFRLGATAFFGAENNAAVGAAIVQHAISFVLVSIAGVWFAARDGFTLGRLKGVAGEAKAAGHPVRT